MWIQTRITNGAFMNCLNNCSDLEMAEQMALFQPENFPNFEKFLRAWKGRYDECQEIISWLRHSHRKMPAVSSDIDTSLLHLPFEEYKKLTKYNVDRVMLHFFSLETQRERLTIKSYDITSVYHGTPNEDKLRIVSYYIKTFLGIKCLGHCLLYLL